ncbi:hypothetical protein HDV01_005641 [Terramyces sp. JEL0728]|nr:hypothetical protein HDV01_005641 [Terramyces sp. JEL0728]
MQISLAILVAAAFGAKPVRHDKLEQLQAFALKADDGDNIVSHSANLSYDYFKQPQDHFDKKNKNTWLQKFFIDQRYFKENGPVILELGGEGPVSGQYVNYQLETQLAKRYNALHIILEHRYYGTNSSQPVENIDYQNPKKAQFKYLTAEQALEDAANFIRNYKLPFNASVWVTFGGSYSGALSAWMRHLYPDLVYAAHASSAPVLAKEDYWEYGHAVQVGLPLTNGGSDACAKGWHRAVKLYDHYLAANATLANNTIAIGDASGISSYFAGFVQYGWPSQLIYKGQALNDIDIVCSGHNYTSFIDPKAKDKKVLEEFIDFSNLQPATVSAPDVVVNAGWTYQYCTEFGYFQDYAKKNTTAYSKFLSVEYWRESCAASFPDGYHVSGYHNTNKKFGGLDIINQATNIVFVNGDIDPWHWLGINFQPTTKNYFVPVALGHHCDDLFVYEDHPEYYTPGQLAANKQILATWDQLIAEIPKK